MKRVSAVAAATVCVLLLCTAAVAAPARHGVRLPPVAGVFDYQLGGSYHPARDVRIVDRDRTSTPAPGRYSICYVNAFQTQADQHRFWTREHPHLLLRRHGKLVQDPGWPGEYLLDTSSAAKRAALLKIVGRWIDGCADKGFDAVEPDNLDSWTRQGVHGAITESDDFAFAALLVHRAHADGLAIAQKNAAEQSRAGRTKAGFDFAIAEECSEYRECDSYTRWYGRHVIEIEYTDNPRSAYTRACRAHAGRFSIILRDRDVVPRGHKGYHFQHC
ncbi:endo alpha-1,4 polygalactosaminidase [Jatrophihabitans endophyticus]|uniref:endo alpha-1,4 polygalactosaminidase n=1 Tax=Jatrophihabitans endophyticus TaxID=1206085 RepID=UPI0019E827C5|nr:endo alpha-1,4 polygalactosaminidase [Jatrophihabitans endophyticus]MBE7187259.1 endo alpha-1,4 polygalactosaminidase [Jatrophihabitans endophyticus]